MRKQKRKSDEMKERRVRGEKETGGQGGGEGQFLAGGDGNKAAKVSEQGAQDQDKSENREERRSEGEEMSGRGGKKEEKKKAAFKGLATERCGRSGGRVAVWRDSEGQRKPVKVAKQAAETRT